MHIADSRPLVMVVNDDDAMRDSLRFLLRLEGAEVRLHGDGSSLLADPDLKMAACLVLKDHLPDIEGLALLAQMLAGGVLVPAILLTGAATSAMRHNAARAGVLLVLEKPILDDRLVDAVTSMLRGNVPRLRVI